MTKAIPKTQPFAIWNPVRGVWEADQPDLFALLVPYSEIWPTTGSMRNGLAYPRPTSALRTSVSASLSSPTALLQTPLASDSSRGGESLEQVRARRGTIALSHQIIDLALHGPHGSPQQAIGSETLWFLIEDMFAVGDATPELSPDGNTSPGGTLPPQRS